MAKSALSLSAILIGFSDADSLAAVLGNPRVDLILSNVESTIESKKTLRKNIPSTFFIFYLFQSFGLGTGGGGIGGVDANCGVFSYLLTLISKLFDKSDKNRTTKNKAVATIHNFFMIFSFTNAVINIFK